MANPHWTVTFLEVFEASGMTPESLSEASGVGLKSVYGYLNAGRNGGVGTQNPRGDTLRKLALALNTTEQYLRFRNAEPPAAGLKRVPLLAMNKMGTLIRGHDVLEAWDGVSVVSADESVSNKAFAVNVTDLALTGKVSPGDRVIIEPDEKPVPGRYVVAVLEKKQEAVLRRFSAPDLDDPEIFELRSENTDFQTIKVNHDNPAFIVGCVTWRLTRM